MRFLFVFLTCSIVLFSPSNAQESIGFSDSTDFQYLIDYQLPSWGYSQFSLSSGTIDLNTSGRDYEYNYSIDERTDTYTSENTNGTLSVSPRYTLYRESERQILYFYTYLTVRPYFNNSSTDNTSSTSEETSGYEEESKTRGHSYSNYINSSLKNYLLPNLFINAAININTDIRFDHNSTETTREGYNNSENEYYRRYVNLVPSFGFGFGKIRNVTPILRALRLNERLNTVSAKDMNGEQILYSAEQFTRYTSYTQTYDRPLKYFWDDLDAGLGNLFSGLDTYDQFYLNDVFNENLGSRYEGYEILLFADYSYYNRLTRRDYDELDIETDRDFTIVRSTRVNLNTQFYKNLTLDHQIHFNLENRMYFPLEREDQQEWVFTSDFYGEWLWILADRFSLTNSIVTDFETHKLKDFEESDYRFFYAHLTSSLTFFVENRMSVSGTLRYSNQSYLYEYEDIYSDPSYTSNSYKRDENRYDLSFYVSIKYYFGRNLF